jgi:hypothetical protein
MRHGCRRGSLVTAFLLSQQLQLSREQPVRVWRQHLRKEARGSRGKRGRGNQRRRDCSGCDAAVLEERDGFEEGGLQLARPAGGHGQGEEVTD